MIVTVSLPPVYLCILADGVLLLDPLLDLGHRHRRGFGTDPVTACRDAAIALDLDLVPIGFRISFAKLGAEVLLDENRLVLVDRPVSPF